MRWKKGCCWLGLLRTSQNAGSSSNHYPSLVLPSESKWYHMEGDIGIPFPEGANSTEEQD